NTVAPPRNLPETSLGDTHTIPSGERCEMTMRRRSNSMSRLREILTVGLFLLDGVSLQLLLLAVGRTRERRLLLSLSARELQRFGKSRADAETEGYKPFWRA